MMEKRDWENQLEERLGYHFHNRMLLTQALCHSSYANERKINKIEDYERLEFLGDAVLELVSSEFLFKEHPHMPEGEMTKTRASMVCEPALAFCARQIGLEQYILLGKGEEATGGRGRDSITSDVLEATIGAIYLDGGFELAKEYIHRVVLKDAEKNVLFHDSKTKLQEVVQMMEHGVLTYQLLDESGPEHDKRFKAQVLINGEALGEGMGHTKKAAEQQAAFQALLSLRNRKEK